MHVITYTFPLVELPFYKDNHNISEHDVITVNVAY